MALAFLVCVVCRLVQPQPVPALRALRRVGSKTRSDWDLVWFNRSLCRCKGAGHAGGRAAV